MKRNVVLYGNSNQGKSTLFGYLFVELNDVGGVEKFENYFKRELPRYNPALLYTWIANKDYFLKKSTVNEFTGEQEDRFVFNESGMSIDVFERGMPIEIDGKREIFTFFDTPGQDQFHTQRDKGLEHGDIGVFCVEMGEVLKGAVDENHFRTYDIWPKISRKKPIVVLTKIDIDDHTGKEDYDKACALIREKGGYGEDLIIIPTCVVAKEKRSANVLSRSEITPWYDGPTLLDAIKEAAVK